MKLYALKFVKSDPKRYVNKDDVGSLARWSSLPAGPDAEFCVDVMVELGCDPSTDAHAEPVWVVQDRELAEKAAVTNAPYFNSSYSTPGNRYVGLLKVVELEVKEVT